MFDVAVFLEAFPAIARAALVTAELTIVAAVISLMVGTLSAAAQLTLGPLGYWTSRVYVSAMRCTPLFVQLLVVAFGLPTLGIHGQNFLAAALAIGLNSGAYMTEILRAAILSVPSGQVEAAEAVGLTAFTIWRRIVLPQALAKALPMVTAEFTIVLKSTPLASVIAVTEMTYAGVLIQSRTFRALEAFVPIALLYALFAQVLMRSSRWLERRQRHYRL
jgi:polar amino acid transport system permease protein